MRSESKRRGKQTSGRSSSWEGFAGDLEVEKEDKRNPEGEKICQGFVEMGR